MPDTTRIATIQSTRVLACDGLRTNPYAGDFSMDDLRVSIERRIEHYEDLLAGAGRENCRLAVITEDFTRLSRCMTFLDDRSIFREAVEWQTPRIAERMGAAARRQSMQVVACYFALEGDSIYNVADLFGPKGELIGRYRKVHLPQYERWQVSAGDAFPAFQTEIGWIGMLICYDQMWPEAASCCAMNGAQIICQPSAAILADYHMRARAMDNQVHFISSAGAHSMITSPRAEILADAGGADPAVVWADVDVAGATAADAFFWEAIYSGIHDHKERHLKLRRPETYRPLTEPSPLLLRQFPPGGVADTPEAVARVYQLHKEAEQARLRGETVRFHWNW